MRWSCLFISLPRQYAAAVRISLNAGMRFVVGDPDEVGEQVAELRAAGLDGVVLNMPVDGFDTESVALAGQTLSKVG